jgi:hypothetical protein
MHLSDIALARRAIKLYSYDLAPKATNRHNQRAYMRSVRQLGANWLLAKPMGKLS